MNRIDLRDRVAVITGGAQGIGYATAERVLRSGARVALWDVDAQRLDGACRTLSALGPVSGIVVELTDDAAVGAAASKGGGRSRAHRHPRQQRRHHRRQRADLGAGARRVASRDRGQPDRAVPHLPRGRAADGAPGFSTGAVFDLSGGRATY